MRCVPFLAALALAAACATARRGEPIAGPIPLSESAQRGQLVFMHECNQCHPLGDAALGPAINNKPIPRAVIKLQVRTGVLGSMPSFSKGEISDEDLEHLLDYTETLRKRGS